jgi:hypothetical protein
MSQSGVNLTALDFDKGVSAIQRLINEKPLGKKIFQKYTRDTSDEMIEAGWRYAVDYIAHPPYIPREVIIEILKQSIARSEKGQPDQLLDNSAGEKLDDAGCLRQIGMKEDWSTEVLEYWGRPAAPIASNAILHPRSSNLDPKLQYSNPIRLISPSYSNRKLVRSAAAGSRRFWPCRRATGGAT